LEKLVLMNEEAISRTITRLCHEIIENNSNCKNVVLIGIHNPWGANFKKNPK